MIDKGGIMSEVANGAIVQTSGWSMHRGQQRPLLVAGWERTALFAGEGDKHFVPAVWAAHASKAFLQIAALEIGFHGMLNDRPPEAVLGLKTLIVDLLECLKMLVDQTPQVGGLRIVDHRSALVPAVESRWFGTRRSHEKNALSSPMAANCTAPSPSNPSVAD